MRIGKFKQITDRVLNEDNQMVIEARTLYEGQAYVISNFQDLNRALKLFIKQPWNVEPSEEIEAVLTKYKSTDNVIELSVADYNSLTSYVSELNQTIPVAMKIIDSWVPAQDKYTVNIKLPTTISDIDSLQIFNERLQKIFKKFSINGKFEFVGFDSGTDWYQIKLTTEALYKYVMAAIALAIAIKTLKKVHYESKTAELAYETARKKDPNLTQTKHLNEIIETKIEHDSTDIVNRLGVPDGRQMGEMQSIITNATKELVKELGQGTEFHLSLNPPTYLQGNNQNKLEVSYKSIPKIEKQESKAKQIEGQKEPTDTDSSKGSAK